MQAEWAQTIPGRRIPGRKQGAQAQEAPWASTKGLPSLHQLQALPLPTHSQSSLPVPLEDADIGFLVIPLPPSVYYPSPLA